MQYAIFSDIHAYPPALMKVLAEVDARRVDQTICLGDVVGLGPDPAGAVELCQKLDICVSGNADQDYAATQSNGLSDEQILWLSRLPKIHFGNGFICTHKKFVIEKGEVVPGFGYLFRPEDADESLDAIAENFKIAFVGHTHEPCIWERDESGGAPSRCLALERFILQEGFRYVVNVGTVGYPRHSGCTSYVIYDDDAATLEFHHMEFDFKAYLEAFENAIMKAPQWVEERIRGNIERTQKEMDN